MRSNWRKTALWAAFGVAALGGAVAAVGDIGPDVDPVYFALPLQPCAIIDAPSIRAMSTSRFAINGRPSAVARR